MKNQKTFLVCVVSSFCLLGALQSSSIASPSSQLIAQSNNKNISNNTLTDSTETLRGIKSVTARRIVLMPVTDKSGQGSTLSDFGSEVLVQALLNGGITTVPWFKVNKALKQSLTSGSPYSVSSSTGAVSDENMPELITISKKLGARYILRPVILSQSENSEVSTGFSVGMLFGVGGPSVKRTNSANVSVKVEIISTPEENIIASKTFSGQSQQVTKDRANALDGITGMQIYGQGSSMDSTKIAFYDTVDKIVEFLQEKTR